MKVINVYKSYGETDVFLAIGEEYNGKRVTDIKYHEPRGEGDAHYCDVYYNNKTCTRILRPDEIDFNCETIGAEKVDTLPF